MKQRDWRQTEKPRYPVIVCFGQNDNDAAAAVDDDDDDGGDGKE